ncbi:phospholipid-transporting ATPase ID-like isoform X2 [Ptychodera flava]|uniref:phospholipid-transporting ATPase ID-like isoform X2 n=1 Tax=Ptychodera flava TaxID=63121 RepID=UPI003969EB99
MGSDSEFVERVVHANDRSFSIHQGYADNYIKTSKYNLLTFIPKNLLEQLQRVANIYFIVLLILQLLEWVSSLNPITTALPLVFVLTVTAVKDGYDDIKRHKSDNIVNNRDAEILMGDVLTKCKWQQIHVADILKIEMNQPVPADCMVLSSSEPHSLVYVETADLDGETNLKVRQALTETASLGDDLKKLSELKCELHIAPPNNRLDKCDGYLLLGDEKFSVSNDQVVLRGCVLRNTKWMYGLTIYTGKESKQMQNSGQAKFKRTSMDKLMNKIVVFIFGQLFVACLVCAISCGYWEAYTGMDFQVYLPWETYTSDAASVAGLHFVSYVILLNTFVPISLYVTVEMIRLAQSFWINWDKAMYDEERDTPAKCRTTTLSEELGQIQYIFSDKTGTLTQNKMTFNKCSIGGRKYGELYDKNGQPVEINENTIPVGFHHNAWYDKKFMWYDPSLMELINKGDKHCWAFFRLLALCHTVMAEYNDDDELEYQAQSPDEAALVGAARNFGFVFRHRTPSTITIEVDRNEEVFELLAILDFNNVRKRMSVILRFNNKIRLYCKGADSVILPRLSPHCKNITQITQEHLNEFAGEGLRTLCLAMKDIDDGYFAEWKRKHHIANTSIENREEKVSKVYEEIEKDMMLLGATAIEDKLQDRVPEVIANLAKANIKIWVLTGDKQETAINIGYSCQLLTEEMNKVFIISGAEKDQVKFELNQVLEELKSKIGIKDEDSDDDDDDDVSFTKKDAEQFQGIYEFALVVNGHSLAHALQPDMEKDFLQAASLCKAVVCCRVTPLQKAMVVELVKKYKNAVTLAIGDGANDVSMIRAAHIGVGISGQEGMQAVLASDFSFAQFRFLERLLLVHGRWSYVRMCKFLEYFFYKNFAFTFCHFWFAFFCGFSAQAVYDQYFISLYNIIFTSLPVIALGIFDQDVNAVNCVKFPKLYIPGQKNHGFNLWVFTRSVIHGILTSLVLFFIPYGAYLENTAPDGDVVDNQSLFGCTIATLLVTVVNLQIALDTAYWTVLNHIVIWGSILVYWAVIFLMYCEPLYELFGTAFTYVGTATKMVTVPSFWFTLILVIVLLLGPVAAKRALILDVSPSLADRIRLWQQRGKQKASDVQLTKIKKRPSTSRPGSSYAFSHQEGYGALITSGRMGSRRGRRGESKEKEEAKNRADSRTESKSDSATESRTHEDEDAMRENTPIQNLEDGVIEDADDFEEETTLEERPNSITSNHKS